MLIDPRWSGDPVGLIWAVLNAVLFVGYIVRGHRISATGAGRGVANLGAAMAVAFAIILPVGPGQAVAAFASAPLVLTGIGVGICSSVVPQVCDQLAMLRLPRASFALMLALLPATATVVGAVVLAQIPGPLDVAGILLVMVGIAIHDPPR